MSQPSRARRSLLAAALATAGLFVLPVEAAEAPCPVRGQVTPMADGWTEVRVPAFDAGNPTITSYAVFDADPDVLLVSNGQIVLRSGDAGCTWRETHRTEKSNTSFDFEFNGNGLLVGQAPTVAAIEAARTDERAYLALRVAEVDGVAALPTTKLLVSEDRGLTWTAGGAGLARYAEPVRVRTSPNGQVVYVLVRSTLDNGAQQLYASTDGGANFALAAGPEQDLLLNGFEIDPLVPSTVWGWADQQLKRSDDFGRTFRVVEQVTGSVTAVDVRHWPGEPARVVAFTPDPDLRHTSTDGGVTWRQDEEAGTVTDAASSLHPDVLVTTSDAGVHVTAKGVTQDVSPRRARPRMLHVSGAPPLRISGAGPTSLFYADLDSGFRVRPRPELREPPKLTGPLTAPPLRIERSGLYPPTYDLVMRPGEQRTVDYRLDLAPVPTPLDVYFMTDSTGSMEDLINGLRGDFQEIVDEIAAAGIDAQFGVADFKDYPVSTSPTDYPYRQRRKIGPVDDELQAAINGLTTGGGSGRNSALAALWQSSLGTGHPVSGQLGLYYIDPGQEAGYRPGSLRVVVVAVDVPFSEPGGSGSYPGPPFDMAIRALNDVGAKVVGLAVGDDAATSENAKPDLETVAEGTGTLAPYGGVDCDDDGEVDVDEGQPLVCGIVIGEGRQSRVAPALLGMLAGLEDFKPVDLMATGEVAKPARPRYEKVNVKTSNRLSFPVTFTCPRADTERSYDVGLSARTQGRVVASATATLLCTPLPEAVRPDLPPRIIAVAAVPPPPAPITQVNPNPNPNPNPNFGAAAEEQDSPQLAVANADEVVLDELAMVAAGVMTAMACRVATQRRTTATQRE